MVTSTHEPPSRAWGAHTWASGFSAYWPGLLGPWAIEFRVESLIGGTIIPLQDCSYKGEHLGLGLCDLGGDAELKPMC